MWLHFKHFGALFILHPPHDVINHDYIKENTVVILPYDFYWEPLDAVAA